MAKSTKFGSLKEIYDNALDHRIKDYVIVNKEDEDGNAVKKLNVKTPRQMAILIGELYNADINDGVLELTDSEFTSLGVGGKHRINGGRTLQITDSNNLKQFVDDVCQEFNFLFTGKVEIEDFLVGVDMKTSKSEFNDDISESSTLLNVKTPLFNVEWDGVKRIETMLDNYFNLDPQALGVDEDDDVLIAQMHLAFTTWALQFVAKNTGRPNVRMSMMPVIMSKDKGIGKSDFALRLFKVLGNASEKRIDNVLNDVILGRLMSDNLAIILNELNPFLYNQKYDEIKDIATIDNYTLDEKFQKVVQLQRKTAFIATTNHLPVSFANREEDRRFIFIPVTKKEDRLEFDDADFLQFWAELYVIASKLTDQEIKQLTTWDTDLTVQRVTDSSLTLNEIFGNIVNKAYTDKDVTDNEEYKVTAEEAKTPSKNGDKRMFLTMTDIENIMHATPAILDELNIKYDRQIDARSGESYATWQGRTALRTVQTAFEEFASDFKCAKRGRDGNKGGRGYFILKTVDIEDTAISTELNRDKLSERYKMIQNAGNTDSKSPLMAEIEEKDAYNAETGKLNLDALNGHMIAIKELPNKNGEYHELIDGIVNSLGVKHYDADNHTMWFWLSNSNAYTMKYEYNTRLNYNGKLKFRGNFESSPEFEIMNNGETECNIETISDFGHNEAVLPLRMILGILGHEKEK